MTLPPVLLSYQREWIADESPVRVWEKSRRIGASWTCACERVLEAIKVNGADSYYSSYNKETTQEFIRDCASWARAFGTIADVNEELVDDEDGAQILTYVIRFRTGFKITALSSKPSNLRNRKGRIVIDEAAHQPDLRASMKAAMAILMWGGRVDILSTHNGIDSEFNRIVDDVRTERRDYSLHRTSIEEAVAAGLYQRICLVNGWAWSKKAQQEWYEKLLKDYGDDADEELRCIPAKSGGTYLSRLLIEDRMADRPVFRFEAPEGFASRSDKQRAEFMSEWLDKTLLPALKRLPKDLNHSLGEDFGRTADLTVLAPCTITQSLRREIPFLVELRNVPFREQEQAFYFVTDRLPRFVYGALDATGNGQYLAERAWQRYGKTKIEQVMLSEKWYRENMPPFRAAFEDGMTTVPRDADVLADLMSFQVINGVPKLPSVRRTQKAGSPSKAAKRHGDAGVAIALAHYASRQPTLSYEYTSAERRTSMTGKQSASAGFRSRTGGIW